MYMKGKRYMYNYKLLDNEEIALIDDNVIIKDKDNLYTVIITNKRLLVLDYPSGVYNSMEDLRISGNINYVKMKEIILDKKIDEIKKIDDNSEFSKIIFLDDSFIQIKSIDVINKLLN